MENTILVVDDDPVIRDLLTDVFNMEGYAVRTAESAEQALEVMGGESIGVLFLDLSLPGMDGLDLCRKIRAENPAVILHAVTGHASVFEILKCREAGFDDYFTKPVDLKAVKQAAADAFKKVARWKSRQA